MNNDFNSLGESVLSALQEASGGTLSERAIQKKLGAYDALSREVLSAAIKNLIKQAKIVALGDKLVIPSRAGLFHGRVRRNERGFGFFIPDCAEQCVTDLFLTPDRLIGVYQNDEVFVRRLPPNVGKGDGCEVISIISRGVRTLTGVCRVNRGLITVVPDDAAFGSDLTIIGKNKLDIKSGAAVLCEITAYPFGKAPQAKILKFLGDGRDYKVREECVLLSLNAPKEFSAEVLAEAAKLKEEPQKSDFVGRTNFCRLKTFTIDGDDSRDFDDAISIKKLRGKGGYELYVHIADVSHYVNSGGALDSEAQARGCSVYLPDRVIPMLPEKLSNGLCSLNPRVKRLCLTAKLRYDSEGNLTEKCFYRSIICSNARLTYKKVQAFFDGDANAAQELKSLKNELNHARELMRLLQNKRKQKGCVDLNSTETKVYFDNGELMVEGRTGLESERLIEEFMIAANCAVAEYLYFLQAPCAYRAHEAPNLEKLLSLAEFFNAIGVKPQWRGEKVYPAQIQKTLDNFGDCDSEELKFIASNAVLRSMQKAYYSPREEGHFGLNEKYYCHFTSPIRRYPDLFVHRVLKAVLCGRVNEIELCEAACSNVCASSSELEKRAEKIERAVTDVYVCEFMRQFLGDYFEGVISGVNSFGFFVRLENTAEGLVKLESLPRDSYVFNEKTYSLIGKKLKFSLGKKVIVKLVSADIFSGKLTFNLEALIK